MGKSCAIIPTIKVGDKEVESRLFKDLISLTNDRETAKYIWGFTRIPEYIKSVKGLTFDENGEPTIESLSKALNLKSIPNMDDSLQIEKRDIGAIDRNGKPIIHKSITSIITNVIDFNRNNKNLVANIYKNDGGYSISLDYKTPSNSEEPNKLMFKNSLNNQLLSIVRRLGFDVKVDDKLTYDGIFDPTNAEYTADGLRTVIRIAKGDAGEDAFPEEFSHLIISGLLKNPLVSRLLRSVDNDDIISNVLGDEYSSYYNKYNGNRDLLIQEVAAKLLQKHIINPSVSKDSSLLRRLWNWVKSKFSSLSENDINDAINRANEGFARLASQVLDDSILPSISSESIINSETLYKLKKNTKELEELANTALEIASRRMKILQARSKSGKYEKNDISAVKNLQNLIAKKKYAESCSFFLTDSLSQIEKTRKELDQALKLNSEDNSSLSNIRKLSSLLRRIKEFSDGYEPIIKQLMSLESMQKDGTVDIEEEDAAKISKAANDIFRVINDINNNYGKLRFNAVYNFLKMFWGEDKIVNIGKNKGDAITLEMIMEKADKDINGIDRWVSSMSDASDPMLSIVDKAVKVAKAKRDIELERYIAGIREAHNKLASEGFNTDFMFERDEDGKLTGRLISDYDFIRFEREKQQYRESLEQKGYEYYKVKSKLEAWEISNTREIVVDQNTGRRERVPKYTKDTLSKLAPAQRAYYDEMIAAKVIIDGLIPNKFARLYNAVQVRDDMINAIANNKSSVKEATKMVLSNIKDNFVRREDDTEYGNKSIVLDFSNNPIARLPIYYTKPLEDVNRLSLDFTSAIMAYTGMAVNYNEMNKIVDALELTRGFIKEREVKQYSGDRKLQEAFTILRRQFSKDYTKKGSETNIGSRIDDYFDAAVYGKLKKDQGTFDVFGAKIDKSKVLDTIKSYTGVVGLGLNTFSAISNVTGGSIQLFIDAVGGEHFNYKNLTKAKKNYFSLLPAFLGEVNTTNKTNKLALLIDKFDALEEFYNNSKAQGGFSNAFSRIIGNTNLYLLNNLGEHYLHSMTMLAMLDSYKVKYKGEEISLFDAFEVEEIKDSNGKTLSAELKLKDGIKKLNGEDLTDNDIIEYKLKIGKVNQSLNGAFNEDDKGAIHRGALGRMAMQFRQWMPAHYNRRYAGAYYDAAMNQWREGYYRTLGRFSLNLMKDLTRARFELATHYSELNEQEKANLRRAGAELSMYAFLTILISMMGPVKDKKGVWGDRMIMYNLKRMSLEVGASIPLSVSAPENIMTILQSPAASINTINNILDLLQFQNMFVELQSGRYKGWSKYERDLIEMIPVYPQIMKVSDIKEEDYMFKIFE